jgi:hypothetical protein
MSQIPLTNDVRCEALQRFGYTPREARFLCLAALHGGYFLRRQYDQFLGQSDGGSATQLIEKTLAKGHTQAFTYRPRTSIYHLCARPFYQALGQVDNRNRRQRQPLTIKNKLMALDFVLGHNGNNYLATEQEKVTYFTETLRLPISSLPVKLYRSRQSRACTTRYFVEKYPIFLPENTLVGVPAIVSFCFVDEGLTTTSRLETFLNEYSRLLGLLPGFQLIYVAATPALCQAAIRAFELFTRPQRKLNREIPNSEMARMLEYFEARHRYENKQLESFDRIKLIQLRKDREEFSGAEFETLFERWQSVGDQAVIQGLTPETGTKTQIQGTFSNCLLEYNYDLFGTLTGF